MDTAAPIGEVIAWSIDLPLTAAAETLILSIALPVTLLRREKPQDNKAEAVRWLSGQPEWIARFLRMPASAFQEKQT
jgi:hypothetical protein